MTASEELGPTETSKPKLKIVFGETEAISKERLVDESVPSYADIVKTSQKAEEWFKFCQKFGNLPIQQAKKILELKMTNFYPGIAGSRGLFVRSSENAMSVADFSFESVPHIAGKELNIPVFGFNRSEYVKFLQSAGLPVAQGYSFQIPIHESMRPLSVVTYSTEQIPGFMPPGQIKNHEKIHGVDPLLNERQTSDSILITEMAATIGEITGDFTDSFRVDSLVDFWQNYVNRIRGFSYDFFQIMKLDPAKPYNSRQISSAIRDCIYDITNGKSNTDIVMTLMSCRSFGDLLPKFKKMFPKRYG